MLPSLNVTKRDPKFIFIEQRIYKYRKQKERDCQRVCWYF